MVINIKPDLVNLTTNWARFAHHRKLWTRYFMKPTQLLPPLAFFKGGRFALYVIQRDD